MRILQERPPNFEAVLRRFPCADKLGVLFAWGDVLYVPDGGDPGHELLAHELEHGRRQLAMGVASWWERYLVDRRFLLDEELAAHRAEYAKFCEAYTRGRARFLTFIAQRLSGPLYGHPVAFDEACRLITAAPGGAPQ